MAFFSEKYGDVVRVVQMGPRSSSAAGLTSEPPDRSAPSGSRASPAWQRGQADRGDDRRRSACARSRAVEQRLAALAEALKSQPEHLVRRVEQLLEERQTAGSTAGRGVRSGGVADRRVRSRTFGRDRAHGGGHQRRRSGRARADGRHVPGGRRKGDAGPVQHRAAGAPFTCTLTDDLVSAGRKAGDLVNRIAALSGGKGGGRPHFASAGCGRSARLGRGAAPRHPSW